MSRGARSSIDHPRLVRAASLRKSCGAVLLGCAAAAEPLAAQLPDTGYATRALSALAASLAVDPTLPDSLRHLTVAQLVAPGNMRYAAYLDDSSISAYIRVTAATLHQLPEARCAKALRPDRTDSSDLDRLLPYVDSGTADQWAGVLARIVRARARPSGGRVAADAEVGALNRAVVAALDSSDRERLVRIAQFRPPDQADACWAIRTILDGMAAVPPAQLGPVQRALLAARLRAHPG